VYKEPKVFKEFKEPKVLKVLRDSKVFRVYKERRVLKDLRVFREEMVILVELLLDITLQHQLLEILDLVN
jgi:hypothetical protein